MLEVTILKTIHQGKDEAIKLRPYIDKCDVFSLEQACATEEEAKIFEQEWEKTLKESRVYAKRFVEIRYNGKSLDGADYQIFSFDELHRSNKPLYLAERFFNAQEAKKVSSKKFGFRILRQEALKSIKNRKIEDFLRLSQGYFIMLFEGIDMRDKEIARNIECAEESIRLRYPQLADKKIINWSIQIGGNHKPEEHTSKKLDVVNLVTHKNLVSIMGKEYDLCQNKSEVSEVERLRWGLLYFVGKESFRYTEQEINMANYDGLLRMATK